MNVNTQICGLVIITMLLFFYNRQPTLGLSSERYFKLTLYVILGCIILDIASCFVSVRSNQFGSTAVIIVNKLYLISLQSVAMTALVYTISDILERFGTKKQKLKGILAQIIFVVGIAATLYLPLETYYDGLTIYSYGAAVRLTFVLVLLYMAGVVISTVALKNYIKQNKQQAIFIWMFIWALAAVIQYTHPKYLIVGFASCVGALIVYFMMENPDAAISRRTGHFSSAVVRDYFDHLYTNRKSFSVMMISFRTVADSASDTRLLRQSIEKLSEFLFTIKTAKIFDTTEGYFILVFDNTDFVESTKFKINTYFQSIEDDPDIAYAITLLSPYYSIVPDCSIADSGDELLNVLSGFIPNDHKLTSTSEVIIDSTVIANVARRKEVENMVISAMENDKIEVFYQPIYDIKNDNYSIAEALVRIRLNNGTLILPDEFIPIVEETGRIIPLSDAIYKKALSFLKSYRIQNLGISTIELNLSLRQAESSVFASRFQELLNKFSIDPNLIELELIETGFIANMEKLMRNMEKLTEYGVRFSLDDFGSGTSNLNYIIDMPIGTVKIDRHVTDAYFKSKRARAAVEAMIQMSHSMGLKIIAEGIEDEEQFNVMKEIGVDYIQGYYFSKPLPEHEFLKFIQKNNIMIKESKAKNEF